MIKFKAPAITFRSSRVPIHPGNVGRQSFADKALSCQLDAVTATVYDKPMIYYPLALAAPLKQNGYGEYLPWLVKGRVG